MTTIARPSKFSPEAEPADRRWTRDEYYRMTDEGFFRNQRVELIEGRILQMSPQRASHSLGIEFVDAALREAFGHGHRFRMQLPLHFKNSSEPEPDVAVIAGNRSRKPQDHPTTAALVVEISDTSLRYDRAKARVYAANGIGEYWIVNLVSRTLEVHRNPRKAARTAKYAYADVRILHEKDRVSPLAAPSASIKVADLLP